MLTNNLDGQDVSTAKLSTTEGEPTTGVQDRRRSARQERATPAWISAATGSADGNGAHVMIRDLSMHGVGLITLAPLKKQDTHWIIIADQSLRLSTRMRVISCRPRDDGRYEVGGEFF